MPALRVGVWRASAPSLREEPVRRRGRKEAAGRGQAGLKGEGGEIDTCPNQASFEAPREEGATTTG